EGSLLRRPISVALTLAAEPENTAALIFEVKGEGTRWLSERKAGDMVDVLGPLGNGLSVEAAGRYLMEGGGSGTPPLLGYAEAFHENAVAVLGFRSADRAILVDRYREACKEVYLCTDDGSAGRHGFVDAQVRDILEK